MPIYNYKCKNCNHEFEESRKIDNRHWKEPCPNCGLNEDSLVSIVISSSKIIRESGDFHSKTDQGFRDNLNRMKKHHPRNTIKTV